MTVCRIYRILPLVHPELCRTIGTTGGSNPEGEEAFDTLQVLPTPGSHIGFSDQGWPVYPGYGRQPLCCGWRTEPAPGASGSCDRLHQPCPPSLPMPFLYYTTGNVGCGRHVYSLPLISEGCAVYAAR